MEKKDTINIINSSSIINESEDNEEKKELAFATLLFDLKGSKFFYIYKNRFK